ncbi:C-terminal binding protein [Blastococcus brunescens]|uniref:C-terminal binding protein n=1 Tax=Blastococcus brunescens TaxID=1564165 RepID=A0ABZ1B8P3_9ACTN|nr:C-terminal binding protein [Blastococcus sp. BMG 8361]WRL65425.1 C-terminal binding protein [Blastococcus sp. BMG 8361]
MTSVDTPTVLLTDRAWPDDSVERAVLEAAGLRLVSGPAVPAPAEQIERLVRKHQPVAVLTNWAQVTGAAIAAAPVRHVARMGVGLDNIDVASAAARGVWVTNVPDYCIDEVSDHALAMVLAWTRGLIPANRQVHEGTWDPAAARLRRLASLTCGVVGLGRIGRATAAKLGAFGARVLGSDPGVTRELPGVEVVDLDRLLTDSDVVVLHAPLVPATHHLIGAREIARMPAGGLLVNVSRGGLVDSDAVATALADGHLSGAALDVLESEPEVPEALRAHPGRS